MSKSHLLPLPCLHLVQDPFLVHYKKLKDCGAMVPVVGALYLPNYSLIYIYQLHTLRFSREFVLWGWRGDCDDRLSFLSSSHDWDSSSASRPALHLADFRSRQHGVGGSGGGIIFPELSPMLISWMFWIVGRQEPRKMFFSLLEVE